MIRLLSHCGILFMRVLARLPLAWVRALGWLLGSVLFALVLPRRRVVLINLGLCFAHWPEGKRRQVARQHFVHFAQAWLDRGWLWHGAQTSLRERLQITGATDVFKGDQPFVIFAPHFVGLDAGWTALTAQIDRHFSTIYSHQSNVQVDEWVLAGRKRFGSPKLFDRFAGPTPVVKALREGDLLYLLPDMNYGLQESVFVPFYSVPAATVTSLTRLAKLGRARVVPVITRMTRQGYEVQVLPAWDDVPGPDVTADTALMNQRLEGYIDTMPEQYFWVHKRFKDRPEGQAPVY
jgi:Kdo2-lipid IVA lauroyltransferase/acyltransferase